MAELTFDVTMHRSDGDGDGDDGDGGNGDVMTAEVTAADDENHPVEDATCELVSENGDQQFVKKTSQTSGIATFIDIPAQVYTLTISKEGFDTLTATGGPGDGTVEVG